MQGCAMQLGDGRVSGIWLCGFHGYAPSRGFVVFTPYYAGWQGIGSMVSFTPYAIIVCIWVVCALLSFRFHGSRRIMGVF